MVKKEKNRKKKKIQKIEKGKRKNQKNRKRKNPKKKGKNPKNRKRKIKKEANQKNLFSVVLDKICVFCLYPIPDSQQYVKRGSCRRPILSGLLCFHFGPRAHL